MTETQTFINICSLRQSFQYFQKNQIWRHITLLGDRVEKRSKIEKWRATYWAQLTLVLFKPCTYQHIFTKCWKKVKIRGRKKNATMSQCHNAEKNWLENSVKIAI
jgi:hypothetical protein